MISVFFLGLLFSFVGYTPPSVLNMTALQIRLNGNQKEFTKFSLGVSLIVLLQVSLSVYLTDYINNHPEFLSILEKIGILVLTGLSIYFFVKNTKQKQKKESKKATKNTFLKGMLLSLLNMFAIPFFCGVIALLTSFHLINFDDFSILFFIIGAVLGAYLILFLYGKFAPKIKEKTGNMTKNINIILCAITGCFAVFTFLKFVL